MQLQREGDIAHTWRRFVLWQLVMTVVDFALLPFALCVVALPWRLSRVRKQWQVLAGRDGDQRLMLVSIYTSASCDSQLLLLLGSWKSR